MATKVTKSIAARIPMETYFILHRLADRNNMSMSDFLNLIIHKFLDEEVLDEESNIEEKKGVKKPDWYKILKMIKLGEPKQE